MTQTHIHTHTVYSATMCILPVYRGSFTCVYGWAVCVCVCVCVFTQIASHRLSSQAYYDFAMRTLKSVLLIAAQLRTAEAGKLCRMGIAL